MRDKGHFWISIAKSIIRIGFCFWAVNENSLILLAMGIVFAEILGILEEVVDRR